MINNNLEKVGWHLELLCTDTGGGFSLAARILGEGFGNAFPTYAFFFFLVHSGSSSWEDWGQVFPDELHVSLFS